MKKLKLLAVVAGTALALSLGGNVLAQPQGTDPQQLQNVMQQIQNMTPEQLDNMRQLSQNIDPEKRQALREQFMNMSPQQQQDALQHLSTTDPQKTLKAIEQGQDLQQMPNGTQPRVKNSLRDQMGVTNDTDWALIEEKINAVKKAQRAVLADSGMSEMMSLFGMGGGQRGGGGFQSMLGRPSPESDALKLAIESDAPTAQVKTLTAKLKDVRKGKLAILAKAQGELRVLLTIRQEAIMTMAGLLD